MQSPAALINKVNKALRQIGPPLRPVYLRTITITGGDPLIGRQTSSVKDVLLDPQPIYTEQHQAGILSNGLVVDAGDFHFLISASSVTRAQLITKGTRLVLKDTVQPEQVFKLHTYKLPTLAGTVLLYSVIARSVSQ